jgi:hypothetical protein
MKWPISSIGITGAPRIRDDTSMKARRKSRRPAFLICALVFVLALQHETESIVRKVWPPEPRGFYVHFHPPYMMPAVLMRDAPPKLRIRQRDYRRYRRDNFAFVFETHIGFKIDTFKGLVTKDMIAAPDTTIPLQLTEKELDRIYEIMIAIRLFDYPEPHPPYGTRARHLGDGNTWRLTVRAGESMKTLSWCVHPLVYGKYDDDWKRLLHLVDMMWLAAVSHPEYQALPKPKGAYQ